MVARFIQRRKLNISNATDKSVPYTMNAIVGAGLCARPQTAEKRDDVGIVPYVHATNDTVGRGLAPAVSGT